MAYRERMNIWREEFESSEELRFQFRDWHSYAYRKCRELWGSSVDLQRRYGGDYNAFLKDEKRKGGAEMVAAREKASRDAALADIKEGSRNPVHNFISGILRQRWAGDDT
ncbi:hypothetical protein LXM94_23655 [Rhizobium sp. TRM95111]|uniref:hypothetical protein n=1 Tax=Rhizobium alarense TaxID=2846851 RepID=UPI001F17142F|nr:hypothetical protein [Rhizobium alarense]MCF3642963.1 hypothetical protein [Rhizobium alarense]